MWLVWEFRQRDPNFRQFVRYFKQIVIALGLNFSLLPRSAKDIHSMILNQYSLTFRIANKGHFYSFAKFNLFFSIRDDWDNEPIFIGLTINSLDHFEVFNRKLDLVKLGSKDRVDGVRMYATIDVGSNLINGVENCRAFTDFGALFACVFEHISLQIYNKNILWVDHFFLNSRRSHIEGAT
jgi:hypothetical protein